MGIEFAPVTTNMSSYELITILNNYYGTSLKNKDFHLSYTYRNTEGYLELELKTLDDLELIRLYNPSSLVEEDKVDLVLENPLGVNRNFVFLEKPLKLAIPEEIAFFDWEEGKIFDFLPSVNEEQSLRQLRDLLNNYKYLGVWQLSTLHGYSLAGLRVVFNGPKENLPEDMVVPEGEHVLIIELRNGFNKGHICLIA